MTPHRWILGCTLIALAALASCGDPDTSPQPADMPQDEPEPTVEPEPVPEPEPDPAPEPEPDAGPSFGTLNAAQLERMRTIEEDRPFYMVNFIKFRDLAVYRDGRETDLTGREANDLYNPLPILVEIGARPVFVADVEQTLLTDDGTTWDQIGVVLYPSRADFLGMIAREDFQAKAVHKDAGVEKTIVLVTEPIELGLPEDFEPADPVFPATDEDSAFEMVHLMKFREVAQYEEGAGEPERSGREAVDLYSANAGAVAVPLGIYPVAWFAVEGALIGDGRTWDEVRLNHFPSHATFRALTSDPNWQEGRHHRSAGLEDTYSVQSLPIINTLAP